MTTGSLMHTPIDVVALADVVIYANHLRRSAYPAMQSAARSILEHGRSLEIDDELMPIGDVLTLIPGGA